MTFVIAPIVEGHGDVAALPVLLRKMEPKLLVKRPVRFPRSKLLIPDQLRRAAQIACTNIQDRGAILLVIDADEDCAATLGPTLEQQLQEALPGRFCRVVLAVREFESWIVGGDAGYGVIDSDAAGDLKGRIQQRHGVYKETADQARFTAAADLRLLEQSSRSFRKFCSVLNEIRAQL